MFKTITNAERFEREMLENKVEEKHDEIVSLRAKIHSSEKLLLIKACVEVNDWDTFDLIVNGIYDG